MVDSWQTGLLIFFRTVSQILTAGISITAFSLLLHTLTFNLRDRVTRNFAQILVCVVIVFTAEAIGGNTDRVWQVEFWLHVQWIGIILLPATYLHFSDSLLAMTGRPSRWRRTWLIRMAYVVTVVFLILLPTELLFGPIVLNQEPATHLEPTWLTAIFSLFYAISMILSWFNFARAYRRTQIVTSRRRMAYLIIGALGPAVGSFPFLLFGSTFAAQHALIFWIVAAVSNLLLGGLVVIMAYAVAFFGVPWPDRIVKGRLFKWIMRGPVVASFALAFSTIARRIGAAMGVNYSATVPIVMVFTVVVGEYLITLLSPVWEKWLFNGADRADIELLNRLQDRLITKNDLRQFLEMLVAAMCDRTQTSGGFVAAFDNGGLDLVVTVGEIEFNGESPRELMLLAVNRDQMTDFFQWGNDLVVPLYTETDEKEIQLLGLMGISNIKIEQLDDEQLQAMEMLSNRAALALRDRRVQNQVFESLQNLAGDMDLIQRMRATGRYDGNALLNNELIQEQPIDLAQWVKEALTHYWGGPKLTENPMMKLTIVHDALQEHEGNYSNALRSILRQAIDRVKPEGDRRFTADWVLYNILELKFLEGRKVRDVASRLAMSEADLYRKQRIAIEAVANAILDMESEARKSNGH